MTSRQGGLTGFLGLGKGRGCRTVMDQSSLGGARTRIGTFSGKRHGGKKKCTEGKNARTHTFKREKRNGRPKNRGKKRIGEGERVYIKKIPSLRRVWENQRTPQG